MLIQLRRLTPLSNPAMTDASAMPMMIMIRMARVAVVAGIPNRYCSPPAICSAPNPSDTASPKRVARTATMSTV